MEVGLVCKICGHLEKFNLQYHLREEHNLTTKQYKGMYKESRTMTGHSKRTVEYWYYRGLTLEESIEKVKESQQTSKKVFVEKRLQNGLTLKKVQEQWSDKQSKNSKYSLQYYMSRGYSHEEAKGFQHVYQKSRSELSSKFTGHKHSKESRDLISMAVKKQIVENETISRAARFRQGTESIRSGGEIQCYTELKKHLPTLEANVKIGGKVVDMLLGRTVIEYYGDFWHRNPSKYGRDFTMYGRTSQEVWDRDASRLNTFSQLGYGTFIIWENTWKSNPELIIEQLKKLHNENT